MARYIINVVCAALPLLPIFSSDIPAQDIQDIVDSTYRNAVVKIDVSSNTAVFNEANKNICQSEGTGFFTNNRTTLITANHVINLDPACGAPIILIRSRKHKLEQIAKPVESIDDIVLLKTSPVSSTELCALLPNPRDAYEARGLRFGIPAGLTDPTPSPLRIGEESGQFQPLVMLNPAPVRGGESGGPVLYRFNVTGIVKARHLSTEYGLMIKGSIIRQLLEKNKIEQDAAFACNPSKHAFRPAGDSDYAVNVTLAPLPKTSTATRNLMVRDLQDAFERTSKQPVFHKKIIFEKTNDSTVTATSHVNPALGWFNKKPDPEISKQLVMDVNRTVTDALIGKWWEEYLSFLDKRKLKCGGALTC